MALSFQAAVDETRLRLHYGEYAERDALHRRDQRNRGSRCQHRAGTGSDFCKRYSLTRLVHVEVYDTIEQAITREKQLKTWQRAWKLNLIGKHNPDWLDLYPTLHLD